MDFIGGCMGLYGLLKPKDAWKRSFQSSFKVREPNEANGARGSEIAQHHKTDHLMVSIAHQVICFYTYVGCI
jgi:hypothetical protein